VGDEDAVERLRSGRAFADLSGWRKVWVSGSDAFAWLNDLVTADLSDLSPGSARQALFLSPRGGLRAAFTVAWVEGGFLLLQDPDQPASIQDLLERYVLSSDVALEGRTDRLVLLAFPGLAEAPLVVGVEGVTSWVPSCLGRGVDVLVPVSQRERLLQGLGDRVEPVGDEGVEAWRVAEGLPRFGVDALEGDLPQESGMASAVSREKGCFPGQEAVAKVDRLGHPRRVVLALEAEGPASAGDAVMRDGSQVGTVTSASANGERTLLLARVAWEARGAGLHTASGATLRHRSA
jgi:folate-binding protein YgfZ